MLEWTCARSTSGATIGAPLVHEKLFLFSGFQATRERTAPPQLKGYLPTAAAINGDFSTMLGAACQSSGKAKQLITSISCFCEHCVRKAREQGIDGVRAREGCIALDHWVIKTVSHPKSSDGTFVSL